MNQITTTKKIDLRNPQAIVEEIFNLPIFKKEREAEILKKRFGILGSPKMTLEKIGKELGITRERVRQIEKNALHKVVSHKESKNFVSSLNDVIAGLFKKGGSLFSETLVAIKLTGKNDEETQNYIAFILTINDQLKYIKENKLHFGVWALKETKTSDITETLKEVIIGLEEEGKTLQANAIKEQIAPKIDLVMLSNILASGKLMISILDKWGLKNWRSINPKSIYDKILIIFNETGEPLHYDQITVHLNDRYSNKKITKKAVHNELIKNTKFVLIGRGIYALKEWGYNKGTVEEVITEILKESDKPLHKNEIIKKVLEKRIVKEATIIINLQKFKRVGKAIYTA